MTQWLKNISAGLCILTILLHLVPQGKFDKYVRFYGGLLFLLVAAEPVLELFTGSGELERLIRLEFLKEDHYELETSLKSMEELKNASIEQAYQQEIQRQLQETVSAYGLSDTKVQAVFEEENGYLLAAVFLDAADAESAVLEQIRHEIAGIYSIEQNKICIRTR